MSKKDKPLILATNDDGINSHFLIAMVEALSKSYEVVTCAPDGERSWIGHAITRHQTLEPREVKKYPGKKIPEYPQIFLLWRSWGRGTHPRA